MSTDSDKLFSEMLEEAEIPTTESTVKAEWEKLVESHDLEISNNSVWSPFWRLLASIATTPVLWLVKVLIKHALPNSFVKFASGKWLDLHAWAVDIERKGASAALGWLVFSRPGESLSGLVNIPAGTIVQSPAISGIVYELATLADAQILAGEESARVQVQALDVGTAYNLGPGYYSILKKAISGVGSVSNEADWLTSPGTDEESDEELRLRIRNQFAAVGQYHTDAAYRVIINAFAGIRIDYLFFIKDAPRGPGTANCYIMIDSGIPTQDLIDEINQHITDSGNHGHGDDMQCFAIPAMPVTCTALVYPVDNLSADENEQLLENVENIIRSAFRENQAYAVTQTMPMERFSLSRLNEELHELLSNLKSIEISFNGSASDIVAGLELPVLSALNLEFGA